MSALSTIGFRKPLTKQLKSIKAKTFPALNVGLQDEIFQADKPVLVGVDAASTYCYLLEGVERRDEDTWGYHLLDVMAQGFDPDYTIADGGSGLRAGLELAESSDARGALSWGCVPYPATVRTGRQWPSPPSSRGNDTADKTRTEDYAIAKLTNKMTQKLTIQQVKAKRREAGLIARAQDVKTLLQRFSHDVLALAGPRPSGTPRTL